MRALIAALALCALVLPAIARDSGQWTNEPPEVRAWYLNAQLTKPAAKRLGFTPCCEYSEVVKTRFRVDRSSGQDQWFYLEAGNWKRVPPDIIHWGESAPGGEPTLFILNDQTADVWHLPRGTPTCFWPPQSGN